jgi:nucleoside-diphosphate-sugar epimerase
MAAGLAYIWIVYLGALCAHDGWISIIHVGDRCAGHRLAEWLCSQGHDVLEAPDLGPDPGDRALLERAAAEGRIQDLDLEDRLRIEQV